MAECLAAAVTQTTVNLFDGTVLSCPNGGAGMVFGRGTGNPPVYDAMGESPAIA